MRIRYHGCNHIVSDLTKVRLTHVRNNIHHLQASRMRIRHGKYYFLVSYGETMPMGLNVTCSKRYVM